MIVVINSICFVLKFICIQEKQLIHSFHYVVFYFIMFDPYQNQIANTKGTLDFITILCFSMGLHTIKLNN